MISRSGGRLIIYVESVLELVASDERSFVPAMNPNWIVLLSCDVVRVIRESIKIEKCGLFDDFPFTFGGTPSKNIKLWQATTATTITKHVIKGQGQLRNRC